jgi:predicted nuclease of predicted toxin-antitoxin system
MIFLANENFPFPSIELLRNAGYEIVSVSEKYSGPSDHDIVKIAEVNNYIIITFDKDYGEIIFRHSMKNPPAVVFFRYAGNGPAEAGKILIDLIDTKN